MKSINQALTLLFTTPKRYYYCISKEELHIFDKRVKQNSRNCTLRKTQPPQDTRTAKGVLWHQATLFFSYVSMNA